MIKNQNGYKIQAIRYDNEKDYISTKFNLLCEEAGIKQQHIAPYMPKHNGVS